MKAKEVILKMDERNNNYNNILNLPLCRSCHHKKVRIALTSFYVW